MRNRYRLYRREEGMFYAFDNETGKRESLQTKDKQQALVLLQTKNETHQHPALSLQKARVYLLESDPSLATRTWQGVMEEMLRTKEGETRSRFEQAIKDRAFDLIRELPLVETHSRHFLEVLEAGTVATNVFLRRIHNYALDLDWVPKAILPNKQWPTVRFKEKRAITWEEHLKVIGRELNPERRAFYELCWHLGGSQGDIACLQAEDIDWIDRTIAYQRKKTGTPAILHFGDEVESILKSLPQTGPFFPNLIQVRASDRATEFKQRCRSVGISGVTLHSYRYAWAERAKIAGMPERFAMENLGHNSKAIHRAYAKKAQVQIPSLEDYEKKILPVNFRRVNAG